MRIIGGKFKGRKITSPDTEATRPISDRMKEALFNILGDIEGLSFLDAYSGSGTVALEAFSRGAVNVTAVESGVLQAEIIAKNAAALDAPVHICRIPVSQWLKNTSGSFDIVFADPPFDNIDHEELRNLAARAERLFIFKHPARQQPVEIPGMELVRGRKYGNSSLAVYKSDSQ